MCPYGGWKDGSLFNNTFFSKHRTHLTSNKLHSLYFQRTWHLPLASVGSSYACNTEKIIYHFKPNSIGGVKFQIIFYPTLVIFYLKAVFFGLGAHSIFFISAHAEATYACNRWHNYIQGSISFLLDICFIYISNIIPFPHFPYLKTPYPFSQTPAHLPTHPTLLSWHGIPLQRGS